MQWLTHCEQNNLIFIFKWKWYMIPYAYAIITELKIKCSIPIECNHFISNSNRLENSRRRLLYGHVINCINLYSISVCYYSCCCCCCYCCFVYIPPFHTKNILNRLLLWLRASVYAHYTKTNSGIAIEKWYFWRRVSVKKKIIAPQKINKINEISSFIATIKPKLNGH